MIADNDISAALQGQILTSIETNQPLNIIGGGSKAFYGNETKGAPLHLGSHTGIVAYEPSELVITARAGTRTRDIEMLLAESGQMLAFEPPCFHENSTIGGAVASGLTGPARLWRGAVRDHVLGVRILTGHGKIAKFGGQVMKNVAGYDVSRLMAGALGTLGVLLEVSLKVIPKPSTELTLALDMPDREAYELVTTMRHSTLPLSAT